MSHNTPSSHQDSQFVALGRRLFGIFIAVLLIIYTLTNASSGKGGTVLAPGQDTSSNSSNQPAYIGKPTKSSGCAASDGLQDKACTPGAVFADATVKQICTPGYSASVRDVTTADKDRVYAAYGIRSHIAGQYEIDHLISLQLGGSNDIANLWPEIADPRPGFHEKDKVENYLHDQLCSGKMTLKQVQQQIATDWRVVYEQMPVARAESLDGAPEPTECFEGCG